MKNKKMGEVLYSKLPQIYRIEDAKQKGKRPLPLKRFLSILGIGMDEAKKQIDDLFDLYNVDTCRKEFLEHIVQTLGFKFPFALDESSQRKFVKVLPYLYKTKGTPKSFEFLAREMFGTHSSIKAYRPEYTDKDFIRDKYEENENAISSSEGNDFILDKSHVYGGRPIKDSLTLAKSRNKINIEILYNGETPMVEQKEKYFRQFAELVRPVNCIIVIILIMFYCEVYNRERLEDSFKDSISHSPEYEEYRFKYNVDNESILGSKKFPFILNKSHLYGGRPIEIEDRIIDEVIKSYIEVIYEDKVSTNYSIQSVLEELRCVDKDSLNRLIRENNLSVVDISSQDYYNSIFIDGIDCNDRDFDFIDKFVLNKSKTYGNQVIQEIKKVRIKELVSIMLTGYKESYESDVSDSNSKDFIVCSQKENKDFSEAIKEDSKSTTKCITFDDYNTTLINSVDLNDGDFDILGANTSNRFILNKSKTYGGQSISKISRLAIAEIVSKMRCTCDESKSKQIVIESYQQVLTPSPAIEKLINKFSDYNKGVLNQVSYDDYNSIFIEGVDVNDGIFSVLCGKSNNFITNHSKLFEGKEITQSLKMKYTQKDYACISSKEELRSSISDVILEDKTVFLDLEDIRKIKCKDDYYKINQVDEDSLLSKPIYEDSYEVKRIREISTTNNLKCKLRTSMFTTDIG